jgi:ferritin-like metal-binding protein YciE
MQVIKDLPALLIHYIQILAAAEEHAIPLLSEMIERARHRSLKNALQHHLKVTMEQRSRLERIPELIKMKGTTSENMAVTIDHDVNKVSRGMEGLIEEAKEMMSRELGSEVTDAAIIGVVQAIEHYEICKYGTAIEYARQLQLHKVEQLLKETLIEEYDADDLLTALATASLNKEAVPEGLQVSDKTEASSPKNTGENDDTSIRDSHPEQSGSERTINSPGGRAGTSHRRYSSGESRGH